MTAQIILFPWWRMSRLSQYPDAIVVATEHIWWLRRGLPELQPQTAAEMVGRHADTWDEVIDIYAELWQDLPDAVRRGG